MRDLQQLRNDVHWVLLGLELAMSAAAAGVVVGRVIVGAWLELQREQLRGRFRWMT